MTRLAFALALLLASSPAPADEQARAPRIPKPGETAFISIGLTGHRFGVRGSDQFEQIRPCVPLRFIREVAHETPPVHDSNTGAMVAQQPSTSWRFWDAGRVTYDVGPLLFARYIFPTEAECRADFTRRSDPRYRWKPEPRGAVFTAASLGDAPICAPSTFVDEYDTAAKTHIVRVRDPQGHIHYVDATTTWRVFQTREECMLGFLFGEEYAPRSNGGTADP